MALQLLDDRQRHESFKRTVLAALEACNEQLALMGKVRPRAWPRAMQGPYSPVPRQQLSNLQKENAALREQVRRVLAVCQAANGAARTQVLARPSRAQAAEPLGNENLQVRWLLRCRLSSIAMLRRPLLPRR